MTASLLTRREHAAGGTERGWARLTSAVAGVVLVATAAAGLVASWVTARTAWSADLAQYGVAIAEIEQRAVATHEVAATAHSQAVDQLEALVVEAWVLYGASSGTETRDPRFDLLLAVRDAEAALRLPLTLTTESVLVEGVEARWPLRDSRPSVVVEVVTGAEPAPAYLAEIEQRLRTAMDAVAPGAGG